MFRTTLLIAVLLMLVLTGIEGSSARLLRQKADGARRECIYENVGMNRRREPTHMMKVGLGEPCPANYRVYPTAQTPSIPSMATLQAEIHSNGRLTCRYAYMGEIYDREIGTTSHCPMTPHFF